MSFTTLLSAQSGKRHSIYVVTQSAGRLGSAPHPYLSLYPCLASALCAASLVTGRVADGQRRGPGAGLCGCGRRLLAANAGVSPAAGPSGGGGTGPRAALRLRPTMAAGNSACAQTSQSSPTARPAFDSKFLAVVPGLRRDRDRAEHLALYGERQRRVGRSEGGEFSGREGANRWSERAIGRARRGGLWPRRSAP